MHGLPQRVQGPDVLAVSEPDAAHALQPRRHGRGRGEGAPRRRMLRRAARGVVLLLVLRTLLLLRHQVGNRPLELRVALLQLPYLPQELLRRHHRQSASARCCILSNGKHQGRSQSSLARKVATNMAPLEASATRLPARKAPFIDFSGIPLTQEA